MPFAMSDGLRLLGELWPLFALLAVGLVLKAAVGSWRRHQDMFPYEAVGSLLTGAEQPFFDTLVLALPEYWICPKVRVADLLHVPRGIPQRQRYLNQIVGKHVDFVLCARRSRVPVAATELDDATHARADRARGDGFLDAALQSGGVPLIRMAVQPRYAIPHVRALVVDALNAAGRQRSA